MSAPDLTDLIARVEGAGGAGIVLDRDIALTQYPDAKPLPNCDARISIWDGNGRTMRTVKPYTASLDAAMMLVPEGVMDHAEIYAPDHQTLGWTVHLMANANFQRPTFIGFAKTLPLALVAAALKARAHLKEQHP